MSWAARWMWRNKTILCLILLVLVVQGFLAYKSLNIDELGAKFCADDVQKQLVVNGYVQQQHVATKQVQQFLTSAPVIPIREYDFDPICNLTSKEAISALQRAKTTACRYKIHEIACASQLGKLYPQQLLAHCATGVLQANLSIGCYRDNKNDRLLPDLFINFKSNNTPQRCIDICLQSGYPYAGVEYGSECFCGNNPPLTSLKLPDPSCGIKCAGSERYICGGYYAINVYTTGIVKFVPQNAEKSPLTVDNKNVRIAFLLTLNGRALRQVHRLIKALYAPQHSFFIHIDARENFLYRKLLPLEQKFPNILLARKRFATIWGGSSLLTMLLQCMKDLLEAPKENFYFDFVINLSESDFPVKTVDKLVNFLSANRERNFVKSHGRETQRFIQKQGLDKTFVECDEHMWRIGDRQLPAGIQVDGGSDWVALSRTFVQYLINNGETDELLKGLLLVFRHTLLPAESFFHTALRNTPFCDTYVDNNLHVTNWKRKLGCKCQYKHVVDWCGCSPNDFKQKDFPRLQATENKLLFFARKFEPIINQAILLQLEEWLYGPFATDVPNLHGYWQSFYAFEDNYVGMQTDLLRSVGETLAQRAVSQFKHPESIQLQHLLELTHYFYQDQYKGFLMRYTVNNNLNVTHELETRVRTATLLNVYKTCKFCQRLKTISVSTDYDQKEQVARNFARILGPYSEPVLSFTIGTSNDNGHKMQAQSITVLWLDPDGRLHDYGKLTIDDMPAELSEFHKPQLRTPLLPGYWEVKLLTQKNTLIASIRFLVSPLTQLNGKPLTQAQSKRLHAGANLQTLPILTDIPTDWYQHIPTIVMKSESQNLSLPALEAHSNNNSNLIGLALHKWLEELTIDTFHLRETCVVQNTDLNAFMHKTLIALPLCHDTIWSSYANDPKSDINTLLK